MIKHLDHTLKGLIEVTLRQKSDEDDVYFSPSFSFLFFVAWLELIRTDLDDVDDLDS